MIAVNFVILYKNYFDRNSETLPIVYLEDLHTVKNLISHKKLFKKLNSESFFKSNDRPVFLLSSFKTIIIVEVVSQWYNSGLITALYTVYILSEEHGDEGRIQPTEVCDR